MGNLDKFRNLHKNSKAFICGAGTSIGQLDLSQIHDYPVVCVNSSILLMPWKELGEPLNRFWMSTDILVMQWDYFDNIVLKSDCTRIVRNSWNRAASKFKDVEMYYYVPRTTGNQIPKWEDQGLIASSSIMSAIDLSLLMGCKHIFLLGVDHRISDNNSHFWQLWPKEKRPRREGKAEDYSPCQRQQTRVFKSNFRMFEIVKKYATTIQAKIYNCSTISKVSVFDHISLEDALKL